MAQVDERMRQLVAAGPTAEGSDPESGWLLAGLWCEKSRDGADHRHLKANEIGALASLIEDTCDPNLLRNYAQKMAELKAKLLDWRRSGCGVSFNSRIRTINEGARQWH